MSVVRRSSEDTIIIPGASRDSGLDCRPRARGRRLRGGSLGPTGTVTTTTAGPCHGDSACESLAAAEIPVPQPGGGPGPCPRPARRADSPVSRTGRPPSAPPAAGRRSPAGRGLGCSAGCGTVSDVAPSRHGGTLAGAPGPGRARHAASSVSADSAGPVPAPDSESAGLRDSRVRG
jgi:hypothetical protein